MPDVNKMKPFQWSVVIQHFIAYAIKLLMLFLFWCGMAYLAIRVGKELL